MNDILKSLILHNSIKKWSEFQKVKEFFKDRDHFFDQTIDFIQEYYERFNLFPNYENIQRGLSSTSEDLLSNYLSKLYNGAIPYYEKDEDFITSLIINQKVFLEVDISKVLGEYTRDYTSLEVKDKKNILNSVENLITKLYQIKFKVNQAENSISSLVYGEEAVKLIKEIYSKIEEKKNNEDAIYFDFGIKGFEEVQIKDGDLVVIGGYTSHGKSVLLRYLIYQFLVKYHMNCCYFSFEMSHDSVLPMFHILHANNKEIFPDTPYISNTKFKHGTLTKEENHFLFKAVEDFANKDAYGTLFIEQPNKSRYSLIDMNIRIKTIESTIMPVHVIGVDYLTQIYPIIKDTKSPDMEDYNQMIRDFKNYILSHVDKRGLSDPIIGITPTQISRKGLAEALKNENRYTLDAIRMYSEMEQSADIVITTLLTDAMRASSQLLVQNLKNRDGEVIINPIPIFCDFKNGYSISNLKMRSEDDILKALKKLEI
jgi:replicative DNA helicase